MSEQSTKTSKPATFNRAVPWLLPAFLIGNFLWRTLIPAHEYPSHGSQFLEMGIDGLLLIGLFGVRKRMPAWLFWIALVAGIGLFAIRFTGDAAWWTGHLAYSLSPR
jgi:hypothetical protein